MATTLLLLSLITGLLYLLLSVVGALRQRPGSTAFTTLLAMATLIAALLAVYLPLQPNADTHTLVLALGAAMAVAGVILLVLERRRADRKLNDSRGILAMGTGVLLLVGLFAGPLIAQTVTPPLPDGVSGAAGSPEMTEVAGEPPAGSFDSSLAMMSSSQPSNTEGVQNALMPAASATPTLAPSATPLPPRPILPSPTPTNTPVVIATWVPTEEAAVAAENALADCAGFVQNNLNLRAEPSMEGELLVTIPSGTAIDIAGTSADGGWLHTTYGQMTGWVSADYVLLGDTCSASLAQTQ